MRTSMSQKRSRAQPVVKERPPAGRLARKAARRSKPPGCLGVLSAGWHFALGAGLLAVVGLVLALVVATGLGLATGTLGYLARGLPSVGPAVERQIFRTATIHDRKGHVLYELVDPQGGKRTVVPLSEMPDYLVAATIATEDPRFYDNPGFDTAAIFRALWQNLRGQTILSGASTITQQLVRNSLMTPAERYERSYVRKLKEVALAYELSQRYNKDEILERYLNEIYYGNLAYGVEAASRAYFGKPAGDLTLGEAALLVGLPQAPSANDPLSNPGRAKARQIEVLGLMVRHGYLAEPAAAVAARQELRIQKPRTDIRAPHFTMFARELIQERYSPDQIYTSGLQVHTTLDLDLQELAERTVRDHVARLRKENVTNAALVAIDPRTGEILAMVGSADYWSEEIGGQVNVALAERTPGSALKPFTYLAAFARDKASPATVLLDEPASFSGGAGAAAYRPENADGKFRGPVTVRRALANSLNVPAVRLLSQIGVPALLDTIHEMGVNGLDSPPEHYGLSLALGTGEVSLLDLTYAYGVLANGGLQVGEAVPGVERQPGRREFRPAAIAKVVDAQGKVVDEYRPAGKRVVSPQAAWLITDILADNAARAETLGPDSTLQIDRPAAAQTALTERRDNAWAIGYTSSLAVGVWVGNANNTPMRNVTGRSAAGQLWHDFTKQALRRTPPMPFDRPAGLVRASVDARTGQRPGPGAPTVTDWFIESSVPRIWSIPTPTWTPTPSPTPTPSLSPTPTATALPAQQSVASPTALAAGMVRVPRLVGLPEAEARRLVDSARLANTYTNYQSAEDVPDGAAFAAVPVGHVVSQTPAPGAVVHEGSIVYLAVRKS